MKCPVPFYGTEFEPLAIEAHKPVDTPTSPPSRDTPFLFYQAEAEANKEYESDVDEDERELAKAIRERATVIKKEVCVRRRGCMHNCREGEGTAGLA